MGIKGSKSTEGAALAAEALTERLAPIEGITSKKMFGGHGIFHEGKMFGIIDSQGNTFLKVDDSIKVDFESKGGEQHSKMPYYSIPTAVMEDHSKLLEWAQKSIDISK
ncbi:MAG: TfoX/Sxy family protein [Flavobacteriaceae bacterium]|nr:TfoX/Sxy family protein [Flavobacteriaceae bacterium]